MSDDRYSTLLTENDRLRTLLHEANQWLGAMGSITQERNIVAFRAKIDAELKGMESK